MMSETIKCIADQLIVVEHLGLLLKGAIAGDDHRAMFVPFTDDLVQVLGGLMSQRMEAKVIQNQEIDIQHLGQ